VHYADGRLRLGSYEVALEIPPLDPAHELDQLRDLAVDIGAQLVVLLLR
jgi:hypothetical protein